MAGGSRIQNVQVPYITLLEGGTPPTPDAGTQRMFIDTADGHIKVVDEADNVTEVGSGAAVAARVKRASGDVAINTTLAAVGFDAEDYDTDALHDVSTNNSRVTIPSGKGGKYHIIAFGYTTANCVANLMVNGSTPIAVGIGTWTASSVAPIMVQCDYQLADGDYVELQVKTFTGSSNVIYDAGVSPILCIHRLGD